MKENIMNHLITLILKSNDELFNNFIVSEEYGCQYHIDAIKNIDATLHQWYGIPNKSEYTEDIQDAIWEHTNTGDLVLTNLSCGDSKLLLFYLPEHLEESQKKVISEVLNELNGIPCHMYRQDGENYIVDYDTDYRQNNNKALTLIRQNN